jgi:hypothetical protein
MVTHANVVAAHVVSTAEDSGKDADDQGVGDTNSKANQVERLKR